MKSAEGGTKQARGKLSGPVLTVLLAISFSHLINDTIQAVFPAIYPLPKKNFHLTFGQVGLITFDFPVDGFDVAAAGGIVRGPSALSVFPRRRDGGDSSGHQSVFRRGKLPLLLVAAGLVGLGSSIFHPEDSRVARLASGGMHGLARSLFQVGGKRRDFGPLLAAAIVVPYGQPNIAWFTLAAFAGIVLLFWIGGWYRGRLVEESAASIPLAVAGRRPLLPRGKIVPTTRVSSSFF